VIHRAAPDIVSDKSYGNAIVLSRLWKEGFGVSRERHNAAVGAGVHQSLACEEVSGESLLSLSENADRPAFISRLGENVLEIENVFGLFVQIQKRIEVDKHIQIVGDLGGCVVKGYGTNIVTAE
jgi:hypothetical protein